MPGTLVKLLVKPGDKVAEGTPLVVLEAMKMEHTMKAPRELTVKAINYKEGSFVEGLSTLLTFE
jgi:3-methylcrotonyl-CoA carboxylase alpha subunit